jgi:hypothetical protein
MLTHCCVGYFKTINIQNDHHQHHFIVGNGVEESRIFVLFLVEQQHRGFQFCTSGPVVFLYM